MEVRAVAINRISTWLVLVVLICTSAEANLISYWKFDESAGTIAYDSQGSNNGTINGATWTIGHDGNGALNFDGANDYVDVPDNSSQQITTNQITLTAWIMLSADVGNTQRRIICKQQSSNIAWGFEIFGNGYGGSTGNQLVFHDSSGTAWYNCISQTHLGFNRWYYIAVTDNAGEIRIYLDGQLDYSSDVGYGIPGNISASIKIGCVESEKFFNGAIDDVRFYDRALSAAEIQQLYTGVIGNNAYNPNPLNGAADVNNTVVLSWTAGEKAASHDVYFGTSFDDVNNATTASSEYKGNHSLNANSYAPYPLEYGITYYWRIDEINDANTAKGFVWNFTTKTFVGWWKFDEIQGNIAHDSAGSNNGTLVNGPAWTTGKIAGALAFDGVDDYVEIPDTNLNLTSQVTLSAWVNIKSRTTRQAIVGQWNYIDSPAKQSVLLDARGDIDQRFGFSLSNDGTDATRTTVYSEQRFLPETWYHVVGTYDGSIMKLYINGEMESSASKTGNIFISNTEWLIGALNSGTDAYFNGIIDDVRIYNRALSETEVRQIFEDGGGIMDCYNNIDPYYWQFNMPDMIHIETPDDVETVRTNVINYLWPVTGWPGNNMPESVTTVHDPDHGINGDGWYRNLETANLAKVDRIDIMMDYRLHSYAYLLHPGTSVNRLLIFHQGHGDVLLDYGGGETMEFFLDRGFSIMAFWMPLLGENWPATAYGVPGHGDVILPHRSVDPSAHDEMAAILENSQGSFIRFFVEPVFVGINYVQSQYGFLDISMTGISGGGWTTHMCAALDPRIKLSFPTAGSLPLFLRQGPCVNNAIGDAEQEWPVLYGHQQGNLKIDGYNSVTGWLDLYILGGYGNNRCQVQILNQNDGCCFWGVNYRTYEPYVRDAVEQLGQGAYSVRLESNPGLHEISFHDINDVIYPTMQENFEARQADFTGDGRVDIDDLDIFTDAWLSQTGTANWNENCDLFDDGQIMLLDFAEFAKFWLWQEN